MKITNKIGLFSIMILLFAMSMVSAEQRLQISMSEVVDQNTSYGYDFDYTEGSHPQDYCNLSGVLNVTNPEPEFMADIYITVFNASKMTNNFVLDPAGRNGTQYSGNVTNNDSTVVLHIPELRQNDWAAFTYEFDCNQIPPPLNVTTAYNGSFGIDQKVLAGFEWTINQSVSNDLLVNKAIQNINITIAAQSVDWNGSSDNFTLTQLYAMGDSANVDTSDNRSWWWAVNGGTLANPGDFEWILFNVLAPQNVPTSDTYLAIKESLDYEVGYLASDLNITSVTAVGDFDLSLDKQIIQASNDDNDTNVTWEVRANLSVPYNVSYNLTQVSVWVTSNLFINDTALDSKSGAPLNITYTPLKQVNTTTDWYLGPSGDEPAWTFNYSDASTDPPIVWLMPQFTMMDAYNQIVYNYTTIDGTDLYMKYIYVVNGYWLQIDKNVSSISDNVYSIKSTVTNIGTAWTPNNTVVTVYDFLPSEFTVNAGEMSPVNDSGQQVSSGTFDGYTLRWTIPLKNASGFHSSLAPMYGPFAEPANATWTLEYNITGNGTYSVSELYIVGLDPRKVDGAGTHEGITVKNAFSSTSSEAFYVAIVFFLVIINVINFVMTRRINDKLSKK